MSKIMKPVVVIILAVAVAAGAAVYLSRQPDEVPQQNAAAPFSGTFEGGRFRGPQDAQVTLVEFGDFQCPSCGAYHPFVKEILNRYPTQVRLEFHHFPLVSIHPNAMTAHKAAEAAAEQGHYWEMHDAIFDYQNQWAARPDPKSFFAAIGSQIGINGTILMQAMESPQIQQRILKDVEQGDRANVQAVPTFFINGQQVYLNPSMEDFVRVIEAHLSK